MQIKVAIRPMAASVVALIDWLDNVTIMWPSVSIWAPIAFLWCNLVENIGAWRENSCIPKCFSPQQICEFKQGLCFKIGSSLELPMRLSGAFPGVLLRFPTQPHWMPRRSMLNSHPYIGRALMEEHKTRQTQKTQKTGTLIKVEGLGVTSINKPFCGNHFECKSSSEKMKMVPVAQQ